MPFDGTDFDRRPVQPDRNPMRERVWAVIAGLIAVILIAMPISAAGLVDIVHYVRGH